MKTYVQIAVLLVFGCDGTLPPEGLVADGGDGDGGDSDANGAGHPDGWDPGQRSDGGPLHEGGAGEDAGSETVASGTCDPIRQLGCGAGEACDRSCASPSGIACRPVSPYAGVQKAPCTDAGDAACAPGYTCGGFGVGGPGGGSIYCTKICVTSADCPATAAHCNPVRCSWTEKTGPYVTSMCSPY